MPHTISLRQGAVDGLYCLAKLFSPTFPASTSLGEEGVCKDDPVSLFTLILSAGRRSRENPYDDDHHHHLGLAIVGYLPFRVFFPSHSFAPPPQGRGGMGGSSSGVGKEGNCLRVQSSKKPSSIWRVWLPSSQCVSPPPAAASSSSSEPCRLPSSQFFPLKKTPNPKTASAKIQIGP